MTARGIHVGALRPSQLLFSYGVGAVLDLPQLSAIVLGVDEWPEERMPKVSEERLLAVVRTALGNQVKALKLPPVVPDDVNPFEEEARIGVPVAPFPRWLRCPRCRLLADVDSGLFELKPEPYRPDRVRYIHDCTTKGRPPTAHHLPRCRGRHPHLGTASGDCDQEVRTILLGASNSWFPATLTALSVPSQAGVLEQLVEDRWALLEPVTSKDVLDYALQTQTQLVKLREFDADEVWGVVEARRSGGESGGEESAELLRPEWEVLTDPSAAPSSEDFRLSARPAPPAFSRSIEQVVLAGRLREVVALVGFTRVDAPDETDPEGVRTPRAPLTRGAPSWVPCTEVRGEGIFVHFPERRVAEWERRYGASERMPMLADAHHRWRVRRNLDPTIGLPAPRYVMLHTLAHALIRELALECGYGAASIRERIYAGVDGGSPMSGILLYTAAPDSEGTLGGLVSLGEPDQLARLLGQALERAALCSSDPLCSEHDPRDDGSVHGAACHACQFSAETSCEQGNRFLDRAALVDTFATPGLGYFT
jgi:hypothetical protein